MDFAPQTPEQVREAIADALAEERPLRLQGRGSKAGWGCPAPADAATLDLSGLRGIGAYEPEELVLTAGPGTALDEIEALLAQRGQELAFEPPHLGPLFGASDGGTLGGIVACNLSGPRRFKAGAARDHFLGCVAVSGRAEIFKAGGRVVKNVTGYDVCKLLAGSHGTLAAMTELTVKVLPRPEKTRTLLIFGLDDAKALSLLNAAAGTPHELSGLAHLPAALAAGSAASYVANAGASVTALRVEGPGPSVEYRLNALRRQFAQRLPSEELHSMNSAQLWREIRDVAYLARPGDRPIWRLSVTPSAGAEIAERISAKLDANCFFDWAGGLIWLSLPPLPDAGHEIVRAAVGAEGHATLIRASAAVRTMVRVFQPQPPALAALSRRVKESFDPKHILNRGRMDRGAG